MDTTTPLVYVPTGMYFDEFKPGDQWISPGRTVSTGDLSLYRKWMNLVSTDRNSDGVPEPLVIMIVCFLHSRFGFQNGTGVANLGLDYRFLRSVHLWDTLTLQLSILSTRPSKSRPNVGIVERGVRLYNQRGDLVLEGKWTAMAARRAQP